MDSATLTADNFTESRLFVSRAGVPIFDEGAPLEWDDSGNVTRRATVADLEEFADNSNRRVMETGDEIPVVIGHTKKNLPEQNQPEIVGFARDLHVGKYGKKKVILATFRFFKDKFEKAMQFPRRSIELLKREKFIDPISLLGATTPERDLGLLYYSNRDEKVVYQMDNSWPTAPATKTNDASPASALVQEVLAMIRETDVWKQLEAQAQAAQKPEMPAMPDDGTEDPGLIDGETDPAKEQYDAGMASGSNTMVPGTDDDKDKYDSSVDCGKMGDKDVPCDTNETKEEPDMADDKVRMEKDSEKIRFAKIEKDRDEAVAARDAALRERDEWKLKYDKSECERTVTQLEGEGFDLDRSEEVDLLASMSPEARAKHVERIRKRYQKAPVGGKFIATAESGFEGQGKPRFSKEQMQAAVSLATKSGLTYEQALAQTNGSAK